MIAHRGTITDRYGEPLAVSTPVDSVWVNPQEFADSRRRHRAARERAQADQRVARRSASPATSTASSSTSRATSSRTRRRRSARSGSPASTFDARVPPLLPGGRSDRRTCSASPTSTTKGQEGLELAYDHWLAGEDGAKRVIQDATARSSRNVERSARAARAQTCVTTIDLRIQYLAYRELKAAVREQRARRLGRSCSTSRPAKCSRWSTSRRTTRTTATQFDVARLSQSRGDRHLRAGLEHQAVRRGGGARLRAGTTPTASIDTTPGSSRSASNSSEDHAQPRHDRPRDQVLAQVVQRRHGEDRAVSSSRRRCTTRCATRLRQGDGQRLSRRVGGAPARATQHWRPIGIATMSLRLRPVGHAAAARAGLRDGRRVRRSPPDHLPARRPSRRRASASLAARGRARAGLAARGRRDAPEGDRQAGRDARLSRRRQDRHGVEGRPPAATRRTATRRVRRRRAGERAAARRRRR